MMAGTRKLGLFVAAGTLATLGVSTIGACGHEERPPVDVHAHAAVDAAVAPDVGYEPQQYVVADSGGRGKLFVLPLGTFGKSEGQGVIIDGLRILVTAGGDAPVRTRAAREITEPPLLGAERIPASLGGGFLFRSQSALYVSPTFDGPLRPLVQLPETIESVSFGPRSVLVRSNNGERWSLDPKTGAPASSSPTGLVDIAALPDGRAAALTEFGTAMVSSDNGAHWIDVTKQLPSPAAQVFVAEDGLWMAPSSSGNGRAVRVEAGGALTQFDKAPTVKPPELRAKDPRWTASEAPIRRALRLGVPLDETTAALVSEGSVAKVSLVTGEILSMSPGRLPPDATCEAMRAQDDVVLACTRPGGTSFVASHLASDKAPLIEQTFTATGQFYAGDDGALAFGGPCTRNKTSHSIVCVRSASGSWQEFDLESALTDGGATSAAVEVTRWIPRGDGGAIGIVSLPKPGVVDARSGEVRPWQLDSLPSSARGVIDTHGGKFSRRPSSGAAGAVIDRTWTSTPMGTLRGWSDGGALDISVDGVVSVSPFSFDKMSAAGPYALAVAKDGRFWQTIDRGATWMEIAGPLSSNSDRGNQRANEPRFCSMVGCDLGSWYRVGWAPLAPSTATPPIVAGAVPRLTSGKAPEITCKASGDPKATATQRTEHSPDDLGLGNARLGVTDDNGVEHVRVLYGRVALNPPHNADVGPDRDESSPRAVLSGYSTSNNDDRILVLGPNKDPMALRRNVAFVAPFDTSGVVRRTSFGVNEIMASARTIGLGTLDVLQEDPTTVSFLTPVLTADPTLPGDLAFLGANGLVGVLRNNGPRARVAMRVKPSEDMMPISAAALAGDDTAILELDAEGHGHVLKLTPGGVTDLFDVPAPADASFYPANPDALAVGAHNDVAVLRTPSGGTPPSAEDPALLMVPGSSPVPLAAWSTLVPADDPACKSDTGGWRAIVQTVRPWVTVRAPGFQNVEEAPSFARVRWTASHVCLEAIEVRVDDVKVHAQEKSGDAKEGFRTSALELETETWVVARFAGAPSAVRVGIGVGVETRQPLECTIAR
jgi:hypothetical protein